MSRIFIGGLPDDATRTEVEREFESFGRIKDVWVARNPPGFGFIIYDDGRDADDAVRQMDGKRVCGSRVRVEFARGPSRGGGRGGRGGGGGRGGYGGGGGAYGRDRSPVRRRRSRTRSRTPERRRPRSRSRSADRPRRNRSPSVERKRSRERRSESKEREKVSDKRSSSPERR